MKFTAADFCAAVEGLSLQPNVLTRCPDQWVGNVECSNQGFEYLKKSLNVFSQRLCIEDFSHQLPLKRLILVLESPHVDEFENYSKTQFPAVLGPANGRTGLNIRNHLSGATREFMKLECVELHEEFALILMNPVPFQCSLGQDLSGKSNLNSRKNRDSVFRACWSKAKPDFCTRLNSILTDETLVVNACTKGQHKGAAGDNWLRSLVDDAILACGVSPLHYLRRCHPSGRYWRLGRSW